MPRFFVVNVESNSGESLHQAEVILKKNFHADELPAGVCVDEKIVDKNAFLPHPNMAMSASRPSKFHFHAAGDYSFDRRHLEYVVFFLRRLIDLPLPLRAAVDFVKRAASNLDTLKMLSGLEEAEEMEDPFDEELPMEKRVRLLNKRLAPPIKTYFCA
ncbi:hypothetical protein M3Y99_00198900 [Aphelenchoides fujianensis]|nr:hypothetical protein M3Y99_00198900 [Aphelenchoides fujianensis]